MRHASRRNSFRRIRTLPGDDPYDRRGRKTAGNDYRTIALGCGVVVGTVVLIYVVYAILLVASGWNGR